MDRVGGLAVLVLLFSCGGRYAESDGGVDAAVDAAVCADPNDYDRSCEAAADCVAVLSCLVQQATVAGTSSCNNCIRGVSINTKDYARYEADLAALNVRQDACPCPAMVQPICNMGRCE